MTLEETAQQVMEQASAIREKATEIETKASLIVTKYQVGIHLIQFSDEDKQRLIEYYQTQKAELTALVEALP